MNTDTQAAILRAAGRFIGKRLEALEPRFKELETRAMTPGPDGKKGEPGPAPDFETVKLAVAAIAPPMIEKHFDLEKAVFVERAEAFVKALPVAVGEKGDRGDPGPAGDRGADGKSITLDDVLPVLKSMQAEWALDFEKRAQSLFQKAVDAIPKPVDGKDGRHGTDGIGWDDMQVEHDGKRTVTLKFVKGDVQRVEAIVFPCTIDAGFFKEGQTYEEGDGVTFGGSYWIAQKSTTVKPEVGSEDWRLAVRKGRDGKRD